MSAATAGTIAVVAGTAAGLALLLALGLWLQLRRLRAAQAVVLGNGAREDLVAHAAALQQAYAALRDWVQAEAERLDLRMAEAEQRLDGAIAHRALVRYDAYAEMGGHQSTSVALLDANRDGLVLSTILHRDAARFYCKQVLEGEAEVALSPEEAEAVRLALAGERGTRILE